MACFMGMCLGINWIIGLYLVLITIILTVITDYVAVATIMAYLAIPLFMALAPDIFFGISGLEYSIGTVTITLFIGLVGIWKHRGNISNLLNKKEKGLREALKKHSK